MKTLEIDISQKLEDLRRRWRREEEIFVRAPVAPLTTPSGGVGSVRFLCYNCGAIRLDGHLLCQAPFHV